MKFSNTTSILILAAFNWAAPCASMPLMADDARSILSRGQSENPRFSFSTRDLQGFLPVPNQQEEALFALDNQSIQDSDIQCAGNHAALDSDCEGLINTFFGDNTVQNADENGRVGITFGSCLSTVNYNGGGSSVVTVNLGNGKKFFSNHDLALLASVVGQRCFKGAARGVFLSGTMQVNGNQAKYCLCNNHSGGSC